MTTQNKGFRALFRVNCCPCAKLKKFSAPLSSLNLDSEQIEERSVLDNYGQKYQDHLLEQYKLYVEMMDKSTSRRIQVNSFYTSLLSGLLALLTISANKDIDRFNNTEFQAISCILIGILGLFLCVIWYVNIQSYRQLSSSKFNVIHELEKKLPFECYSKEWGCVEQGYFTQSSIERIIQFVLAVPYISLLVYTLAKFL